MAERIRATMAVPAGAVIGGAGAALLLLVRSQWSGNYVGFNDLLGAALMGGAITSVLILAICWFRR